MVRFGIVGAGLRGRMYAEALGDVASAEVIAFAELSGQVAEATREATGLPVVASHTDLLGSYDLDAVIIATPDFAHLEAAVAAARAGKHLLIEKPLATSVADAWAIRDAVRDGGGSCLVGFENRWNPHVVQTRRVIESGSLGSHITTAATLSNTWYVPTTMLSWAAKSSPAWFLMPHTVDLALWFSGRQPVSVSAVASRGQLAARGIDTVDVVHALITLDDGTTVNLSSAWTLPDGGDAIVDFRYQVIGTEGSIYGDPIHQGLDLVSDRRRAQGTLAGRIGGSLVGAPVWMVQELAAALDSGGSIGPGIEQGVLVTETICAIEQSWSERRQVTLNEVRERAAESG